MGGCTLAAIAVTNHVFCASMCTILRHSGRWFAVHPSVRSFASYHPHPSPFNRRRFSPPIDAIHSDCLFIDKASNVTFHRIPDHLHHTNHRPCPRLTSDDALTGSVHLSPPLLRYHLSHLRTADRRPAIPALKCQQQQVHRGQE